MKNFKIVCIDYNYCNYLRQFDKRVCYNYGIKRTRPFVGVLFNVGSLEYFAPLSSPKPKHLHMRNTVDFVKIKDGKLGAINFNNMIPVNKNSYEEINLHATPKDNKEKQYINLLNSQLRWLNRHIKEIQNNSETLYYNYINDNLNTHVKNRCCNFLLLEEKCKEYTAKNSASFQKN